MSAGVRWWGQSGAVRQMLVQLRAYRYMLRTMLQCACHCLLADAAPAGQRARSKRITPTLQCCSGP